VSPLPRPRSCAPQQLQPAPADNFDGGLERLSVRRRPLDRADDVEAAHDMTERGKTLTVGITFPAKIEFGLRTDTDEKIRCRGVGTVARHGDRADAMFETGVACAFEGDGRAVELAARGIDAALDDLDEDGLAGLVVGPDGAMKDAAVIKPRADVAEKVGGRAGRVNGVDYQLDLTARRFEDDVDGCGFGEGRRFRVNSSGEKREGQGGEEAAHEIRDWARAESAAEARADRV
jgi:hypothetical protein